MMYGLLVRADDLARAAQRRRLEQIAAEMRAHRLVAEVTNNSVLCRGRGLVQRWLGDPALRFLGRAR
jgi:hypothetical protein